MKKITILHPSLAMGGEEKVLINMLKTLDYTRYSVTLWLIERGGVLENQLPPQVTVKTFDFGAVYPENTSARLAKHYIKTKQHVNAVRAMRYAVKSALCRDAAKKYYYFCKSVPLLQNDESDLLIIYHSYTTEILYWGLTLIDSKKKGDMDAWSRLL